jgi:hypothetical protein
VASLYVVLQSQLIFKLRAASVLGFDTSVASSTATELGKRDTDIGFDDVRLLSTSQIFYLTPLFLQDNEDIDEGSVPQFNWLVCSQCNEAIQIDNLENHTRFCKLRPTAPKSVAEKRRLRNEDPVVELKSKIEGFFDQFDGALHLLLASVISFALGSIGLSFAWCALRWAFFSNRCLMRPLQVLFYFGGHLSYG